MRPGLSSSPSSQSRCRRHHHGRRIQVKIQAPYYHFLNPQDAPNDEILLLLLLLLVVIFLLLLLCHTSSSSFSPLSSSSSPISSSSSSCSRRQALHFAPPPHGQQNAHAAKISPLCVSHVQAVWPHNRRRRVPPLLLLAPTHRLSCSRRCR